MKSKSVSYLPFLVALFLGVMMIVMGWGWCSNLLTILHTPQNVFNIQIVLRVIGIFVFPLGAIMGYM